MPKKLSSHDVHGNTYEITPDQLSWRPSAYAIVINDDQILLTNQYGKYHLPGGGVDLGEMPHDAAIREVKEETGVTVREPKFLSAVSGFFTFAQKPGVPISHVQSILMYYQCDYESGDLSVAGIDEWERAAGAEAEWVPLERLAEIEIGTTYNWRPIVDGITSRSR